MTSSKKYAKILKKLPSDVRKLTEIVHGLAIHEFVADTMYGVRIPEERSDETHIRFFDGMLDGIFALNFEPLANQRTPKEHLAGVCHHFAVLLVGMLRAKGIPGRVRYGFGDYFNPRYYEDHSLCEYYNEKEKRWILVDPQFDENWRKGTKITRDVLDVPRDRFLVAGEAWIRCRSGELDPSKFGIFRGDMRGCGLLQETSSKMSQR